METQTDQTPDRQVSPRRPFAHWRLVLGIALILAAGLRYVWTGYRPRPVAPAACDPDPIRVPPELKPASAIPVSPGALAGCNVLLVTLDTTRADRIGCYGNANIQTPALDRLARAGVLFSAASATAPSTLPAHASVLTGLYPAHHGAQVNGLYRLSRSHPTLASVLAEQGYATGAMISAFVLDASFGLDHGFDVYDDDLSGAPEVALYRYKERKADQTTDQAMAWLESAGAKPFFLWVHYFDPHLPHEPPPQYTAECHGNPYDGEIAFVDAQFGRLLSALDTRGLTDRTLIVVVGDHGESLGQHDEFTHGLLTYESTQRVPLLMACGTRLGGGVHISRRVSQVDLMPTVLALLGLPAPTPTDGIDLTTAIPESRPIYAETLHGLLMYGWAALLAVYEGPLKYIHGPHPELFDLSADPNEHTNLLPSRPQDAERLRQRLVELFGPDLAMTEVDAPTETRSMADLAKLRALGYVGAAANIPAPALRPDPRQMMLPMNLVDQIVFSEGDASRPEVKIQKLEAVVRQYPQFHPALRYLGDLYRLTRQNDRAIEVYTRATELSADPTTLFCLGYCKLVNHDEAGGAALLREVIARYPDHLQARQYLALSAAQSARYAEAAELLKYIFDVDPEFAQPDMPPCAVQLVQVYTQAGRAAEVPALLQSRLEANPRLVHARAALAVHYMQEQRYAAAEAVLREGVALLPNDPNLVANLAGLLVTCPEVERRQPYEGIAMLERLCRDAQYRNPDLLLSLSLLDAQAGRLDEGIAWAEKARALAAATGDQSRVDRLDQLLLEERAAKRAGGFPSPTTAPESK
jgi:arylsulfatase A-like enzyme/cytochrome c-type biogenesis protein CcmH/NrfG